MKTREKILLGILVILLIAGAILAWIFIHEQNKVKEYSTYCMDRVRHELGEQLENIHMTDAFCSEGICVYMGGTTYEGVDYAYACKVYNKENVELGIEPLYSDVCEGEACDVPGTSKIEEAEIYTIMGPNDGFDEQIQEGKLVLRKEYEDHTDYIFIDQSLLQNYFNSDDEMEIAYGENVSFKGNLTSIDGAAGSHYYNANTVEELNYVVDAE